MCVGCLVCSESKLPFFVAKLGGGLNLGVGVFVGVMWVFSLTYPSPFPCLDVLWRQEWAWRNLFFLSCLFGWLIVGWMDGVGVCCCYFLLYVVVVVVCV